MTPQEPAKRPSKRPNEDVPYAGAFRKLTSNDFELICERLAESGTAIASCEELGFKYQTVRAAMDDMRARGDESWHEAWDFAMAKFRESLEREIFRRGRDGRPKKWLTDKDGKPVLDAEGKMIVTEVEYSDRMLELAARGHMPERYRDRVSVSGTLGLEPVDAFSSLSPKAKRKIIDIAMADLEEQRQLAASRSEPVDAEYTEVTDALEDLRRMSEENE